jgi:uncharacterized protein
LVRSLAALYVSLVLTVAATAAPSFDCEKAVSDVEKFICQDDGPITGGGSAWLDSQLARLYAIAKERISTEKKASFVDDQRKFLQDRDTCFARRGCRIEDTYRARLKSVARAMSDDHAFQVFAGAGGLQIARYGKTASLSIWTVGGNNHACQFEKDDLPLGDDGVVRFDDEEMQFHIVVAPVGDALRVTTEGGAGYCGARASMNGTYVLRE